MKLINVCMLSLAFPLLSQAGTLLYPQNSAKALSYSSLEDVNAQFGLGLNASEFTVKETKKSLLGTHIYYQQVINGYEVENSQVVVSLNQKNELVKVYHSVEGTSFKFINAGIPFISEVQAIEAVWKNLQVNGELLEKPQVSLIYQKDKGLVYKINISVSSPAGHWEVMVNAHSGAIIHTQDAALPRMKRTQEVVRSNNKSQQSFKTALLTFESKKQNKFFEGFTLAAGSAQVFDPNPVVTLQNYELQDDTEASVFAPAYRNEDLKDITFSGGVYRLAGPKITLVDFEGPSIAPVTTKDGHWIFERGQSGFTDAMTYLHIDRSIRYIESLGFTGNHAVFNKSLEVDSDGLNGQDNSHYIPYQKRLAFGHGCVDDNEDANVILHELGHAIQDHINPSWGGGDSGAMGEGFGDYWAASYDVTTEHGMEGNINWVFKFDGHNECWPGRKLDSTTPSYDASRTYYAHSQVNGGISDEMWSTPLFQAFLEMHKNGVSKTDIDKIILEAHFGLGSGLKMHQMATSIVKTAKTLFPNKNYDQVFLKHFKKQKILN